MTPPTAAGGRFAVRVTGATLSLCLCALTHSYLLFSVFPYQGYMSVSLLPRLTVDDAGLYCGLLGSSFTLGRSVGFAPWKSIRSSAGLRSSLLLSLFLSAAFSVAFGLSRTYAAALATRFLLGVSNGISGAVKRAAMDDARRTGDVKDEERSQALVLSLMSWGLALGPLLGGTLSDPAKQYPDRVEDSFLGIDLEEFPYLLPNLAGAALCLLSMASVATFVEEVNRDRKSLVAVAREWLASAAKSLGFVRGGRPRKASVGAEGKGLNLAPSQTYGTDEEGDGRGTWGGHETRDGGGAGTPASPSASSSRRRFVALSDIWKGRRARSHLIAYWSFSFVVVCIDEALPLFLISRSGGPALMESSIGWVLSVAGLMSAIGQLNAFRRLFEVGGGLHRGLKLGAVLGNVPSALFPLSLILGGGAAKGRLTWPSFAFLVLLAGSLKIFATLYFALVGIATGWSVPPTHRSDVARFMTLGALASRSLAPTVAGGLVSFCVSGAGPWNAKYGSIVIWSVVGLIFGSIAAALSWSLGEAPSSRWNLKGGDDDAEERRSLYLSERQRAQVYVKLWEVHYDKNSNSVGAKWRRVARKAIALNRFTKGHALDNLSEGRGAKPDKKISWKGHSLHAGVDVDEIPFFILGTHKNDGECTPHVLTPPLMDSLKENLPNSCAEYNFWLKYSLVRDGSSIHALHDKVAWSKHTILAVETLDGHVFGYFTSEPWVRTDKYVGCGESFLWRLKKRRAVSAVPEEESAAAVVIDDQVTLERVAQEGDVEIYRWTGENDLCQYLGQDRIAVGGGLIEEGEGPGGGGGGDGFGFVIQDNLLTGSSSPCRTYRNLCLVPGSEGGRFEVANVEVWAMTPFLLEADAERSERYAHFVKENIVTPSNLTPWSNFL